MNLHVGNGLDADGGEALPLREAYLEAVRLIERTHRSFLDVVKEELERTGFTDLNNVQAVLLFNIGAEELAPFELKQRGYYLGSNVSYNLKKLIDLGYAEQRRSAGDRRTVRVRVTDRGRAVVERLEALVARQLASLGPIGGVGEGELAETIRILRRLDRYFTDQVRYRL